MKYSYLFLIISVFGMASAQEWGEISEDELKMTGIPEDPEANAVILFDLGEMQISNEFSLEFSRHTRIKVLREEGKDQADFVIPYHEDYRLADLEAVSYSPDGNEYELDDDQVFEQQEDEFILCRFSVPGVQVGSVIEVRYQINSKPGYLGLFRPWYFQNNVYTRLSQLSVILRPGFNYTAFHENLALYDFEQLTEDFLDIDIRGKKNKRFIWRVRSVPPLKHEPFMYNRDDYLAKIYFQLVSYDNGYDKYTFIKSWDDLAKQAYEILQQRLGKDADLEEISLVKTRNCPGEIEKITRLYSFVNDSIETMDTHGLWDFSEPEQVMEKHRGTPSAKNLLLMNLLAHAGIKSDPVFISSRNHGKFYQNLYYLAQFDHFLVRVPTPSGDLFLDTSDKFCPPGTMKINYCVADGFLIGPEGGQVINIRNSDLKNRTEIRSTACLNDTGVLASETSIIYEGYPAISFFRQMQKEELKDIAHKQLEERFKEFNIDSAWIEYPEGSVSSAILHISFTVAGLAEQAGNMVYLPVPLLSGVKSSPFVSESRSFPVDYPYEQTEVEYMTINLPADMQVSDLPAKSSDRSRYAAFTSVCFKGEQKIELNRNFSLRKTSFQPSEYKDLRHIYNSMVNADQGQIVLNINR
jgi:hypothetical protein